MFNNYGETKIKIKYFWIALNVQCRCYCNCCNIFVVVAIFGRQHAIEIWRSEGAAKKVKKIIFVIAFSLFCHTEILCWWWIPHCCGGCSLGGCRHPLLTPEFQDIQFISYSSSCVNPHLRGPWGYLWKHYCSINLKNIC